MSSNIPDLIPLANDVETNPGPNIGYVNPEKTLPTPCVFMPNNERSQSFMCSVMNLISCACCETF